MRFVVEMGSDGLGLGGWQPIARFVACGDAYAFYRLRSTAEREDWRCYRIMRGKRQEFRTHPRMDAETRARLAREVV